MPRQDENEILDLLRRNNELLSVLAKTQLRETLESELADPIQKELYSLTGKNIPIKKISTKIKASTGNISRTWQRWEHLGILIKEGKYYRKVFP